MVVPTHTIHTIQNISRLMLRIKYVAHQNNLLIMLLLRPCCDVEWLVMNCRFTLPMTWTFQRLEFMELLILIDQIKSDQ